MSVATYCLMSSIKFSNKYEKKSNNIWHLLVRMLLSCRISFKKKYKVHGVKRRSSSYNTSRIDHILESNKNFLLHYGDVTDAIMLMNIINRIKPDEIYNLSAQSHVAVSFEIPEYTANVDALGALRILEAINVSN